MDATTAGGVVAAIVALLTCVGGGVAWLLNHFASRADSRDKNLVNELKAIVAAQDARHEEDQAERDARLADVVAKLLADRDKDREERIRDRQLIEGQFASGREVALKTVEAIEKIGAKVADNTNATSGLNSQFSQLTVEVRTIAAKVDDIGRRVEQIEGGHQVQRRQDRLEEGKT